MTAPLTAPDGTQIIETFGWEPAKGPQRIDRHLARLQATAKRLGFPHDAGRVEHAIAGITGDGPQRCRLTLNALGQVGLHITPMAAASTPWTLALADHRLDATDPWLSVKTTQRAQYDRDRAHLPAGVDELLYLNTHGELCEGTITNLFVDPGDGTLRTPPLSSGVLPGILRAELLDTGKATEAVLTPDALTSAQAIFMGNSLRGLIPARINFPPSP